MVGIETTVGVSLETTVSVGVIVAVCVSVEVTVGVNVVVAVTLGISVAVSVGVSVGVSLGVLVDVATGRLEAALGMLDGDLGIDGDARVGSSLAHTATLVLSRPPEAPRTTARPAGLRRVIGYC